MVTFPKWASAHIIRFIKFGYILILIGTFYLLKITLDPNGQYEVLLASFMTAYFIECIISSSVILTLGSVCLLRFS